MAHELVTKVFSLYLTNMNYKPHNTDNWFKFVSEHWTLPHAPNNPNLQMEGNL